MKLKVEPIFDKNFLPMAKVAEEFVNGAKACGGGKLIIGIERNNGFVSSYETVIYPETSENEEKNIKFAERIIKSLLWIKGGI